ncbi:MAG: hypothetical protein QG657_668 [Acidobacteriota bacterium]|nr:hypothetical protein [Acidobacteriota bacterium]
MEEKKNKEYNFGVLVLGSILVGVGVLMLAANIIPHLGMAKLWPLFMLIPVAILIAVFIQDKTKLSAVIFPVILLLFYCGYFLWLNFTTWEYAATTWPNFLIGPGLGFLGLYFAARKWEFLIPAIILLMLAAIFYGAIIENTLIVGILFIAVGLLFILKPLILAVTKKKMTP